MEGGDLSLWSHDAQPSNRGRRASNDGATTVSSTTSADAVENSSLRFAKGKSESNWKPVTLRPVMLLSMIAFAVLLIAALEYLSRVSDREGGIVFSTGAFPAYVTFVNLYLPTILAVALGMLWTWIDLDARRLEPYFQLSKHDGATSQDSLNLDYPFDYVALASYKALRKGHWSVVFASVAMMTIFWAVTPLLSAIFSVKTISQSFDVNATITLNLVPGQEQASSLTTDFTLTAYNVLWIGQDMPAFTTLDTAILPFAIQPRAADQLISKAWGASTTTYGTNLTCKEAIVIGNGSETSYSNSNGCVTYPGALQLDHSQNFTARYIGYYEGSTTDYSLSGMGCSDSKFTHTFLAFWAAPNKFGQPQITASFCEPSYWKQQANVTILSDDQSVLEVTPLEDPQPLTDSEFNITNFEFILSNGSPPQPHRAERPAMEGRLSQLYRLAQMGISPNATITNMIGYALGATRYQLDDYLEPVKLASAFEKAHKILFALAAHSLITLENTNPDVNQGWNNGIVNTVIVDRTLSIAAEAALGFIVVTAIGLIFINLKRTINLGTDPASLHAILSMMSSEQYLNRSGLADNARTHLERGKLYHHSLQGEKVKPELEKGTELLSLPASKCAARPVELKSATATIFVLVLALALSTLFALKVIIDTHEGLPIPSTNDLTNQLLTNYLPVIFATFLEPFWTLLNRFLCLLKPFDALRNGEARPSRSLYLKYTSLPPPLAIWRAFKARHFTLVATCAIGLSTNILTVAMSGLFLTKSVTIISPQDFVNHYSPILNASFTDSLSLSGFLSQEFLYVANSNISDGVTLPPWTTKDMFFIPFHREHTGLMTASTWRAHTQGFGASLECHQAPQDSKPFITANEDAHWNFLLENGKMCSIDVKNRPAGGQNNSNAASEVFKPLSASGNELPEDDAFCETSFMAGFLRANLTVDMDGSFNTYANDDNASPDILSVNTLAASWMVCQSTFLTASYEVTVDGAGRVQEAVRKESYAADTVPFFLSPLNETMFMNRTRDLWELGDGDWWHNDTFSDSWFGYFIKELSNSTQLVDPNSPVPSFDAVMPFVQETYSRMFAIMLGLNPAWFIPGNNDTIQGSVLTTEDRLFLSTPAFIIAVTLLILNIAFAVLYYVKRPAQMLKRMPTTIGSVLDLFAGSGLVTESSNGMRLGDDVKLGYGRFVGTDGKPHLGIERRPFIIPWGKA